MYDKKKIGRRTSTDEGDLPGVVITGTCPVCKDSYQDLLTHIKFGHPVAEMSRLEKKSVLLIIGKAIKNYHGR